MATPTQQPDIRANPLMTITPFVETFSKGIAGFAIAVYGSGFLIVSLHHSQYGFVETNPFRPRILAAGAWFFFLMAIPVASATTLLRGKKLGWETLVESLYPYYFGCMIVSGMAQSVFNLDPLGGWPLDRRDWLKMLLLESPSGYCS